MKHKIKHTLKLPRPLANQIMHLAQNQGEPQCFGLLIETGGECRCYSLTELIGDVELIFEKVSQLNNTKCHILGCYYVNSLGQPDLFINKISKLISPIFIVALATKGVIEISAFHQENNVLESCYLELA